MVWRHLLLFGFFLLQTQIYAQSRYGLFIATNYKGSPAKISELNLCEADAQFLQEKIQKVGNFASVKTLLGAQVTKENVKTSIAELAKVAKKEDTVFLYFSGHGMYMKDAKAKNGMRNYLICYDRPHISDEDLNDYLSAIRSTKTIFVFDCCYSGGIAKKGKNTRGNAEVPIAQGSDGVVLQNPEDFFFQDKAMISSSDDDQTSIEVGGTINHGIFTYNFGNALEKADLNNDKVVTALEAFFLAQKETVAMAKQFQHEQTPQISGNAAGIFLSGNPVPAIPSTPVLTGNQVIQPVSTQNTIPEPTSTPPNNQTNVLPPIVNIEPPTTSSIATGSLIIKTNIITDKLYAGVGKKSPYDLLEKQGKLDSNKSDPSDKRSLKVYVDEIEVPVALTSDKSMNWGSIQRNGQIIPGDVFSIRIDKLPAGVHQIEIRADGYPAYRNATAIVPKETAQMSVTLSLDGMGAIQGRIFYKTLDNPIEKHPIYMPTIVDPNQRAKVTTDKDGYFWFTNLKPGKYEIRASFQEELKLENSEIEVRSGEITKLDIILNKKLSYTKTKY